MRLKDEHHKFSPSFFLLEQHEHRLHIIIVKTIRLFTLSFAQGQQVTALFVSHFE